jgi:integrase
MIAAARTPQVAAYLILGAATGFRCSELLSLRYCDVAFDGRPATTVSVPRRRMKNGRSQLRRRSAQGRSVPLNADAQAAVAMLLRDNPPPGRYLFASRVDPNRPIRVQTAILWLRQTAIGAGIDPRRVTTHSLRKAFSHRLLEITGSVVAVSRGLGHRSLEVTAAYLDVEEATVNDAILAMSAIARSASTSATLPFSSSPTTCAAESIPA